MNINKFSLIKKITLFLVLFGVVALPVSADDTTIVANGAESTNQATSTTTSQVTVQQSNSMNTTNNLSTSANTGNNTANNNTEGTTGVSTGTVNSTTNVSNAGNVNTVDQSCGCAPTPSSTTTISGNGANSSNSVNQNSSDQNNISVSNSATITNNVATNANTGDNSVNNNTGGSVTVKTGDITTSSNTNNGFINFSHIAIPASSHSNSIQNIIGNGAFSLNNLSAISNNNTRVTINNFADVLNNIESILKTGGNNINNNTGGNATIKTGKIITKNTLLNGLINYVDVLLPQNQSDPVANIIGNGAFSLNNLSAISNNNINISISNSATITNNIATNANTGDNSVNNNTGGSVTIVSGDILTETTIANVANISIVDIACGCKEDTHPSTPPPSVPPVSTIISTSTPGGGGSSNSSNSQSAGQALSAAIGTILPATGNNWLFFALIGNIAMLLLGAYLRLRSGRSPGFAFAF